MNINLNQIDFTVKQALNNLLSGDNSSLIELTKAIKNISSKNKELGEVYHNEFLYSLNKEYSKYYIEFRKDTKISKNIKMLPSVWISNWCEIKKNEYEIQNIDSKFDLRCFDFNKIHKEIITLNHVFDKIFPKTKSGYESSEDVERNLFEWSFADNNKESNINILIRFIYTCASLQYFYVPIQKENINVEQSISFLLNAYYGKQKKENKNLFSRSTSTTKNKNDATNNINIIKESELSFRNEDKNYWKFLLNIIPEDKFISQFIDVFEIVKYPRVKDIAENVCYKIYKGNFYKLLNDVIPNKRNNVTIKNKIKV